jgi:hypothetical protein
MAEHPLPTIAQIFRDHFDQYVKTYGPLPADHYKVAHAIMDCRTEAMGGHLWACPECHHERTMYNSCRNRHCPRCQAYASAQWVQARIEELLPVPYFHVVFTIPHQLNAFALRNKSVFYSMMFRAVALTLQELGDNHKYLGGTIGFIAILHTWGQNLMDHPHIHCVIPGAALSHDRRALRKSTERFLFPVPVMRALFRGKLMAFFKHALDSGDILLEGALQPYTDQPTLKALIDDLYRADWVVYAKRPFAGPQAVIKYLGAYTHRIAISDKRLLAIDPRSGDVTFRFKDYARKSRRERMTLSPIEFIRRFLLHVVPSGFMRIRHYGLLSNRLQHELLPLCKELLGVSEPSKDSQDSPRRWYEVIEQLAGKDPRICPKCAKAIMVILHEIPRKRPARIIAAQGGT